jgi:predicted nucleic acid-binding protein
MTKYLLDTNVVLRLSNPSDDQHELVTEAIATLVMQGDECYLIAKVLIELWVVATRPINVNGLGWSAKETRITINQLLERFPFTEEVPQIFSTWLTLVTENQITGKRTHDVRIIAAMIESGITHVLTLNPKDFLGISGITVVHPRSVS